MRVYRCKETDGCDRFAYQIEQRTTYPQPVELVVAAQAHSQCLGLAGQLHVQHVRQGLPHAAEGVARHALAEGLESLGGLGPVDDLCCRCACA